MSETAVYSILSNFAGLTALVAARIFNGVIDQTAAYPQISFAAVSTFRPKRMGGNTAVVRSRIQVNCYGDTKASATDVAEQVRAALSWYTGAPAGVTVQVIFDEAESSDYDDAISKHKYIVEFLVWYEE